MKYKIIKIVCLFCLLLCSDLLPHNEFYRLNGCTLETFYTNSNVNILKWQAYSNIRICRNFTIDFPYSELFQTTCETDYTVALWAWQNVTFEDMYWDEQAPWIRVRFNDDPQVFPDPNTAGGTLFALQADNYDPNIIYIVGRNPFDPCVEYVDNYIYFNSREDRTFYWTHNTYIPYDDNINFKYTLIHELGHEIGLAHCDLSSAIMHATPPTAPYFVNFIPQPPDIEGLNIILYQNPYTQLKMNPAIRYLSKQYYFFQFEPEILLYSQKKTIKSENKEDFPEKDIPSPDVINYPENKLFTKPENISRKGVSK